MKLIAAFISILLLSAFGFGQGPDYTRHVNPFIGTGGHGHTFPGATVPFGMVQLSPDTRIDNWDGSSGYHYSDNIIYGFSHTHLSGTGIPDGCDILFMPTVGEPQFFAKEGDKMVNGYASKFSHANEKAEPGYYSAKLDDDGILAEMTATQRVGFHRYTFPNGRKANLLLDLTWRDKAYGLELNIVSNRKIVGTRRSSSWAKNQTVVFVAEFSKPFVRKEIENLKDSNEFSGLLLATSVRASFQFDNSDGKPLLLKVALSSVSISGAEKNLEVELPHWDFDMVRADAKAAWNKELSKIEVSGGTPEQTTNFYTALYHTMIHPNIFNDVDGNYRGHDGKIHNLCASETGSSKLKTGGCIYNKTSSQSSAYSSQSDSHYTVFSLWDTFRAAHPLYTIIDQKRTVDFINTFIRIYEQGGRLPVWELWGEETDTMIGYHAVSVIADAMAKGIKGFDYEKAYQAAKHSAELDHFGLAAYKKRGYISGEDENESVSKTLEYAYNDYCIATMGQALLFAKLKEPAKYKHLADKQLEAESEKYFARSLYYRNLFDPETRFFRPKRNGGFLSPFAPNEVTFHFTEGNSWQYSFFVPHDVSALAELHGGKIEFVKKLDELFTTEQKLTGREQPDITGLIGQYAHGNEPSHHIAYLYNYANQPWKTQGYVRRILDDLYKNAPDGLIGNEDCGQMSAWYVLSALGFYQVNPSRAVYDIGTPIFKEAKIKLENGKIFTIKAPNVSAANRFIKSVKLNGKPHRQTFFHHRDLMNGGTLEFEMADSEVKDWFTEFSHSEVGGKFVAVPLIEGERVFKDQTTITLRATNPNATILYSINGTGTDTYETPLVITKTSVIRATAGVDTASIKMSPTVEAKFYKKPNDWSAKAISPYSSQYTGGGDDAIIDGLRGNANFASGEWQGYQGKTFEALIDLQRETEITKVGGSFLQSARSWIWMPDRLEFEASTDGTSFTRIADFKPGFPQQEMNGVTKEFVQAIRPARARYIRVRAYNFGKIPAWHAGAGGDPWIFVDEIIIK